MDCAVPLKRGDEATCQQPLGAVACWPLFLLTCALLMTSSHSEGRIGAGGFVAGCGDGMCIGLPAVGQFGPPWMQETVMPQVLSGRKRICLAITEPEAGSGT